MEETEIARTPPAIGGYDRLSFLPDEVISHILSFLETKYAVGTAVLSRRWGDLWTRVSSLDLDNRLVFKTLDEAQQLEPLTDIRKRRYFQFRSFVDKVLNQHKNLDSLGHFRLHVLVDYHPEMVIPEVRFKRELVFGPLMEEIDVMICEDFNLAFPRWIPGNFYTLKNLKVAKLSDVFLCAMRESVSLPNVEILQLSSVVFRDFESLGRLISGCPVLRTLHLEICRPSYGWYKSYGEHIIQVSLPCLKNLKITDSDRCDDPMCPIVMEAPNLEDLYLEQFADLQVKGSSPLSRLHSARVGARELCRGSYHDLIRLLPQLSNAKQMSLSGHTLSHLFAVDEYVRLPVFPKLTCLTIEMGGSSWVLHSLLNSVPNLQSLVIDLESCSGSMMWESLEDACTPECLLSSLEEIEVKRLVGFEPEKKIIAYFLKAGAVLKKVNMHVHHGFHQITSRKDLMSLLKPSRGSRACEACLFFPNGEHVYSDSDDESNTDDDIDDDSNDSDDETDSNDSDEDSL